MARVTQAEVREVLEVDTSLENLQPFVDSANLLVTALCSSSSYSAALLAKIELWLAAHFVAIRDPRTISEAADAVSATFGGKTGMGLEATLYGQQALALDYAGNLRTANLFKGTVGVTWMGKDLSDVTDTGVPHD